MEKLGLVLVIFLLPFGIVKMEKRLKLIEWLSPVVCCYAAGIILGNLLSSVWDVKLARTISEVSVMLAMPLLLFSTDLVGWLKLAKTTIISFALLIVCVMGMSYLGGILFQGYDPEVWKMAGMLVGVYVGGTANLTAIGKMVGVSDNTFVMLNAVEVAIGGFYLLIIMSFGVKLLTKLLKPFDYSGTTESYMDLINWKKLTIQKKIIHSILLLLLSGGTVALSLLISHLTTGGETASVIILGLTVLALVLSLNQKVRHFEGSQEWGQYLLLVFCLAVGSMAQVDQLLSGKAWYFGFTAFIMFGSVILHFLCCFLLKIDRDTAIITSMAGIYGPPFVAPMSQVLKNRAILVSGVTTGLVGIALGNFAGIIIAYLLK